MNGPDKSALLAAGLIALGAAAVGAQTNPKGSIVQRDAEVAKEEPGTHDGVTHDIGPGTALLIRTGSSHGIKVVGNEDLVLIITYQQKSRN